MGERKTTTSSAYSYTLPNMARCLEDVVRVSSAEHGVENFQGQDEKHGQQQVVLPQLPTMPNRMPWHSIREDARAQTSEKDSYLAKQCLPLMAINEEMAGVSRKYYESILVLNGIYKRNSL